MSRPIRSAHVAHAELTLARDTRDDEAANEARRAALAAQGVANARAALASRRAAQRSARLRVALLAVAVVSLVACLRVMA